MDYHIALSPDLDISSADFAEAWNETEHAQEIAPVTLTPTKNESFFFDQAAMDVIISTATTIGVGVVTNAIYDVLKSKLPKKVKPHKHLKFTQLTQPDGTQLIVVDEEDA